MRPIEFKAWDENTKEMYFPDGIGKDCCNISYNNSLCYRSGEWVVYEGNRKISPLLMQYTGLKDKNGKKIFEGDYVNSYQNDYEPTLVYWDDDLAAFVTDNYHSTLLLSDSIDKNIEVIGNKFSNPELLK